jgi:hypothetical protein
MAAAPHAPATLCNNHRTSSKPVDEDRLAGLPVHLTLLSIEEGVIWVGTKANWGVGISRVLNPAGARYFPQNGPTLPGADPDYTSEGNTVL